MLTQLIGPVAPGDRVVVNTTAVDLGLGTGGWHVVHWNLARDAWEGPSGGHIVKLRYTSLQVDTGAAEDDHQELLAEPIDLQGLPVVYCGLHSQVACLAAVIAAGAPGARVAYVMTEAAALPLAFSDLVAALEERGLLHATITAGQAFGGAYEAVNVPSALAVAAAVVGADAVIVGPGPGVVGTGTALGAGALELAAVVDAALALGGDAVVALRFSEADSRPRHQGVSRQTLVALGLAARSARLPVPIGPYADRVANELKAAGADERHRIELVDAPDVAQLLAAAGLAVTTMGRDVTDDPGFFTVTAAAGAAVARGVAARARR